METLLAMTGETSCENGMIWIRCDACEATGTRQSRQGPVPCEKCSEYGGTGEIQVNCLTCSGRGRVKGKCELCQGLGLKRSLN